MSLEQGENDTISDDFQQFQQDQDEDDEDELGLANDEDIEDFGELIEKGGKDDEDEFSYGNREGKKIKNKFQKGLGSKKISKEKNF